MRNVFLVFLLVMASAAGWGQSGKQVQWSFSSKKIQPRLYEVHMMARVGGNFHIYAQNGHEGPVPTSFRFARSPQLMVQGNVKEAGQIKTAFEKAFQSKTRYYEGSVDFVQVVQLKSAGKAKLNGSVQFMVCNAHECLPPDQVDFSVPVGD